MVALTFFVAVGVEEPVFGLTGFLIVDRLFSGLYDAVLAEAEVCDLIVRHIHDLSSGLHDAEITECVFFRVDREQRIPFFRGNVWFSGFKVEGVDLVRRVDPGNTLNGVETFGAFLSVPGRSIVLVIRDLWGYSVAGGRVSMRPLDGMRTHPVCIFPSMKV